MNHGVIEDQGPPERIYLRPRSVFAAGFMGEINMIDGTVEALETESVSVVTPLGRCGLPAASFAAFSPAVGQAVKLGIRPEHIRPNLDPGMALDLGQAEIVDEAFFGTHHRCHLALRSNPERTFTAHLPQAAGIKVGDLVPLRVAAASVVVLADRED
jgi:spermidine/putrescine transport system ATP-binding protein